VSGHRTRTDRLATEFESIAVQLRDCEATLYGHDVETESGRTVECGGVARTRRLILPAVTS